MRIHRLIDPGNRAHRSHRVTLAAAALALVATACSGAAATGNPDGAVAAQPAAEPAGPPVPETSFELFEGGAATLASFQGAPLVVNFWASWCPSCVAEMSAAFKPVQQQLGDEVTFLGMNIQDERELALELLDETGVQWISAEDPDGELYVELGGIGMPFTVFVSSSGEVVDRHNGPLNESQLRERIEDVLGV